MVQCSLCPWRVGTWRGHGGREPGEAGPPISCTDFQVVTQESCASELQYKHESKVARGIESMTWAVTRDGARDGALDASVEEDLEQVPA